MELKKSANVIVITTNINYLIKRCEESELENIASVLSFIRDARGKSIGAPKQSLYILVNIIFNLENKLEDKLKDKLKTEDKDAKKCLTDTKTTVERLIPQLFKRIINETCKMNDKWKVATRDYDLKGTVRDIFDAIIKLGSEVENVALDCAKEVVNIGNVKFEQLERAVLKGLKSDDEVPKMKLKHKIISKFSTSVTSQDMKVVNSWKTNFFDPMKEACDSAVEKIKSGYYTLDKESILLGIGVFLEVMSSAIARLSEGMKYSDAKKLFLPAYKAEAAFANVKNKPMQGLSGEGWMGLLAQVATRPEILAGTLYDRFSKLSGNLINGSIGVYDFFERLSTFDEDRSGSKSRKSASGKEMQSYDKGPLREMKEYHCTPNYSKLPSFKELLDLANDEKREMNLDELKQKAQKAVEECKQYKNGVAPICKELNKQIPPDLKKVFCVERASKFFAKLDKTK